MVTSVRHGPNPDAKSTPEEHWGLLLDEARAQFSSGSTQSAISALRDAVRRAPARPEPALLLCSFLIRLGDPDAQPLLDRCLVLAPRGSSGWGDVGEAFLAKKQIAAALVCFGRGVPDAKLFIRCGLLARELGQSAEAVTAFEQAVRLDPRSTRAWFLLGNSAQDAGDPGSAAAAYREVLRLDSSIAEAAVNLGMILQETGDLKGAKDSYAQAMQIRPDTFGRIAQALPAAPRGELWLDLGALRRSLAG